MAVNETPVKGVVPWNCTIFWEQMAWAGSCTAPFSLRDKLR